MRGINTDIRSDEERREFGADGRFGWVRREGSTPRTTGASKRNKVEERSQQRNNGVKQFIWEVSPTLDPGTSRGSSERDSGPPAGVLHGALLMANSASSRKTVSCLINKRHK